jgi:hypothetical protein
VPRKFGKVDRQTSGKECKAIENNRQGAGRDGRGTREGCYALPRLSTLFWFCYNKNNVV